MQQVTLEEATARLEQLIQSAREGGEEVVITRDSAPVAKLVPIGVGSPPRPRREPGSARGLIQIPDDFDAPLEDFAEYM